MSWKERSKTGDITYLLFPRGHEKDYKISVSVAGIRVNIQNGHILSACPQHYHCLAEHKL